MPKEYQDLIRQAGEEATLVQWKATVEQEKADTEVMKAAGCSVNTVSNKKEWIDLIVAPVYAAVEQSVPRSDIEAVQNTK
jgi:TRAP-type C4-dicarboxylate transport system substrate-binding protein